MNSTVILESSHCISDSNLDSNLDLDPDPRRVPAFVEFASANVTDSSSRIKNLVILNVGEYVIPSVFQFYA
jgi:hypothetical protein